MSSILGQEPSASFTQLLQQQNLLNPALTGSGLGAGANLSFEATTIVALVHAEGAAVTLAADRRASAGHRIAKDDMQKLFLADRYSSIGIAGSAGIGVELTRLFAMELEHIEKIESRPLSHEGKIRRLSMLLASNLGLAMQGLAAVPIFAGFDHAQSLARLHTFDPTGGAYEEKRFAGIGSGSEIAEATLLSLAPAALWQLDAGSAQTLLLKALHAASRKDSATSGLRGDALPLLVTVNADGASFIPEPEVSLIAANILAGA